MDKRQISSAIVVALAIMFVGTSVASSKLKTLKSVKAGNITNPYIRDGAVNSAKIEDGTVSNADLAANSVDSGKIVDGSITDSDLTDGAVTSAKIALGTVTNANVSASAAIAGTKIAPNFGSQNIVTTGDITTSSGTGSFNNLMVDDAIQGLSGGLYVEDVIHTWGLQVNPSSSSSDSASIVTTPVEGCSGSNKGAYEYVDDTNSVDGWLFICDKKGATSYDWKRIN
jgi:hypothetical protein